ncbi:hypothetical protein IE81DRAFT_240481 [Ceraceosorus guamensis]|uniref:Uncharacterized protein n=1 Tax=Ceraceosorus guamensis TaxID=1522189 RepID=A0A316WB48_9BASI|nr:hypothetical protein IE81DRAFT_240481 [Ceraceosorus guamensis]PWN44845.1 hypothetical protein IE81DRAFT_240481 [Ceraceosorus guamensis]
MHGTLTRAARISLVDSRLRARLCGTVMLLIRLTTHANNFDVQFIQQPSLWRLRPYARRELSTRRGHREVLTAGLFAGALRNNSLRCDALPYLRTLWLLRQILFGCGST